MVPNRAVAQPVMGARPLALGQAVTALPNTPWSAFSNPAMMPFDRYVAFYGVQNYRIPELTDMAAVVSYPLMGGGAFGGYHRYGNELYNENRIRLGYGYEWRGIRAGLVLNYRHVAFGGSYGNGGTLGLDLGVGTELYENLWFGAYANNINQPKVGGKLEVPRKLSMGFSYKIADRALLATDLVKDVDYPLALRSGLEIMLLDMMTARAGVTTEPTTYSFGLGIKNSFWKINFSVQHHQALSWSPGIDLQLLW